MVCRRALPERPRRLPPKPAWAGAEQSKGATNYRGPVRRRRRNLLAHLSNSARRGAGRERDEGRKESGGRPRPTGVLRDDGLPLLHTATTELTLTGGEYKWRSVRDRPAQQSPGCALRGSWSCDHFAIMQISEALF